MRKSFRILAFVLSGLLILTAAGCSKKNEGNDNKKGTSKKLSVGIIQYMEHVALDDARKGFIDALKDNGYVDGENITIDVQNAQGDQSNLSTISDRFVSNKVDLVLAIATPAAQSIAGKTKDIPILATAVTDFVTAKLVNSNEAPGGNVSGTTDMNPIKEQIDLLVKLVPDAKTVGVLYTSSEDNSILQASIAKEAIENLGLKYVEVTVTNSNDVQQATQSIVEQCDAIYIPTDNTFASAMPVVHGITSQSKTPVICGESGMVNNGGLATLGINYYNLGYQTGLMAIRIFKGEATPATMPIEASKEFDFAINGAVAEEIGIEIPEDLKEYIIKGE
ncbi:sugar ABC transporter substrate-binding protein [Clostridium thermosuccinogenes]|uniref:Sugar ABC transporter substrate-binding protein n=1 Tax=Clostridium thermosuccinogenes TaxID=84032 RepID=A0A2K2FHR0_9CLOT|nr:ABC transporter substrate-binding protein [Pseudoclostridium thermosuccinogenes]AUS95866.1 sugar ABC transporter substrate-binding protein [Pseudoclostridium thermosuccinogenes]PNT98309.1 sugar ABC transporter substrate-binding protein [Pseudoclostridium thermosuccinogenes]PNU00410.1 sugar ABC transporter substrate-binding protein [Pseudoclostridium thermosuccinogenes]